MRNTFYRYAFPALICLIFFFLVTFLLLKPENVPIPVRGLDAWVRANWTVFIWIMMALSIVDFVFFVDRFHAETKEKLEALEKQVAELKSDLRDLTRKI